MKGLASVLWALFILFIFDYLVGIAGWMYYSFFLSSDKSVAEYTVIEKQSQKGMFFPPRYQVVTEGNKTAN